MGMNWMNNITPALGVLDAVSYRQKLVSNNIANAHTPGYSAQRASFSELLANANNPFETNLSAKMGTVPGVHNAGGPVSLQKEMLEMQKNNLFFAMASRRLTTVFTTLRTASQIGR